ncbi:MAG: DUF3109 family protein [Cytophagales bacterium]|nr:DUF3109 family protein [Cytophagales bacterium]MDW8384260.1 DUF3109 family protein [Flammeovirgaceae bacterium]
MLLIGNTLISDDIAEKHFLCDLEKCKGACCIEGDLGAPLEESELEKMQEVFEIVMPMLAPENQACLEEWGPYVKDYEGDYSTPILSDGLCAYAIREKNGIISCSIEKAWKEGKTTFRKPISCHLYPIRIKKYPDGNEVLNYHKWKICKAACKLGEKLKIPLYQFLKEALIRKYGEKWYEELLEVAQQHPKTT